MQAVDVKSATDPDNTDLELTPYERDLMETANGQVMLLNLRGRMIFGASRAISRTNSEVEGRNALVIDLQEVTYLGVSAAVALEAAILDMVCAKRCVYLVGLDGQPRDRLEKLGVLKLIPPGNLRNRLTAALERAIYRCESNILSDNIPAPFATEADQQASPSDDSTTQRDA